MRDSVCQSESYVVRQLAAVHNRGGLGKSFETVGHASHRAGRCAVPGATGGGSRPLAFKAGGFKSFW